MTAADRTRLGRPAAACALAAVLATGCVGPSGPVAPLPDTGTPPVMASPDPDPAPFPKSADEAVARARAASPQNRVHAAAESAAARRAAATGLPEPPELRAGADPDSARFAVRFRPKPAAVRQAERRLGAAEADATRAEILRENLDLDRETRDLWADWLFLRRELDILERAANLRQVRDEQLAVLVARGMATATDRLATTRDLLNDIRARERCRRSLADAERRLQTLLGTAPLPPSPVPDPDADLPAPDALGGEDRLVTRALERAPGMHVARAGLEEARARLALTRAGTKPGISFIEAGIDADRERDDVTWALGGGLTVPFGKPRGRLTAAASADAATARERLDAARETVAREVSAAFHGYADAARALEEYLNATRATVADMQAAVAVLTDPAAAADPPAVTEARLAWLDHDREILRLRYARLMAFRALEQAVGGALP